MTRIWPAFLLLWIYSSANGSSSVARASMLAADPLVGCYEMTRVSPASAQDTARIPMPPSFRLDSVLGTGAFNCGKTRVLWASPPQGYFAQPIAWARVGPDSIRISWSNGFGGLVAELGIHGNTMRGTATTFTDMRTGAPDPTTAVMLVRIPCPPPPTDSAALAAHPPPGTLRAALISAADWDSLPVGDTTSVFVRDSVGWINQLSQTEIRWYVSDTTVATIDSSGLLRARKIGRATVIARAPHRIAEHSVNVVSLHLTQISTGLEATCGVTTRGDAICWGGWPPSKTLDARLPNRLVGVPRLTTISVGFLFSCGLENTGSAYCADENSAGPPGHGHVTWRSHGGSVTAADSLTFTVITAGVDYACGIARDSTAYCWGSNGYGQLGTSSVLPERCDAFLKLVPCSAIPVQVSSRLHFHDLAAAYDHTCGVLTDATIMCWGDNSEGQLGDGSQRSSPTPVRVASDAHFSSVTVGGEHTCAVTTDGRGYCWGGNQLGELGSGDADAHHDLPAPIAGDARFRTLAATGSNDTCGLTQTGAILCWGMSQVDAVSPLRATDRCNKVIPNAPIDDFRPCARRPVPQGGGETFVFLGRSLGGAMCALDAQGRPFCWGGAWSAGNVYACGEPTPPVLVGGGPSALWLRQSTDHPDP